MHGDFFGEPCGSNRRNIVVGNCQVSDFKGARRALRPIFPLTADYTVLGQQLADAGAAGLGGGFETDPGDQNIAGAIGG